MKDDYIKKVSENLQQLKNIIHKGINIPTTSVTINTITLSENFYNFQKRTAYGNPDLN